jgi:curved DNA-binding protein CbpA
LEREWLERDYYKDLGVSPSASPKEISDAYRKLAKKYHPDTNQGDEAARDNFTKIATAYEVLRNAEKRKEYDEAREMMRTGGGAGRFFGSGGAGSAGASDGFAFDMSDILGNLGGMFGNAGGGSGRRFRPTSGGPRRGQDLEADLYLDFLDAVHGRDDHGVGPWRRALQHMRRQRCAPGNGPADLPELWWGPVRWPWTKVCFRSPSRARRVPLRASISTIRARLVAEAASRCARETSQFGCQPASKTDSAFE